MVGKRVRGATYVHASARDRLDAGHRERLAQAELLAPNATWNVARVEAEIVGLLLYEEFDEAFPALLASTRVELATGRVTRRDHQGQRNPLILHRKELLVDPSDARVAEWARLTRELEARGLFRDSHLIGRREQWLRRLGVAGVDLRKSA